MSPNQIVPFPAAINNESRSSQQQNSCVSDLDGCAAQLPWYAVMVRTRSELAVVDQFALRGLTAFSPVTKLWKRYSDRRIQVAQPLFPGYVFCQFDIAERVPVLATPGVSQIVGIGPAPEPVPAAEIFALQQVAAAASVQAYPYLRVGQRVRVEVGPFAGVEGLLIQVKGADRLVVSINLLQRSISAEVDPRLVTPLDYPAAPHRPAGSVNYVPPSAVIAAAGTSRARRY